ncbi:SMAD/FHA domain-containing protein [Hirschfeldia incana]|nr:SMAD/FHA domain-containing protein [Hirschfeldia incana]
MEIEGEDGTKLILKPGDKTIFGRGAGFTIDDLTVSRRHVSLELKPSAGGTDSDRVSFEVLGRNPVWVRKREPGEKKIRTFRRSETGEIDAGDRFCVSGQLPVWFTLKRCRDEATEERASGSESGLDCIDGDPVKEFGFLVIGKEFDQYPKSRIRDIKQWEWFLEDSKKGKSDDDDDDDKKGRKGLSKKRRRRGKKGNEEDDDWSAESEEDKDLMVKSKRVVSPTYSTRSKKTKKDVNASSSSSSSRVQTKQLGRVDIDEDSDDETLGGFIVSDEEAELEEEEEPNTDDDEELVEDEDED